MAANFHKDIGLVQYFPSRTYSCCSQTNNSCNCNCNCLVHNSTPYHLPNVTNVAVKVVETKTVVAVPVTNTLVAVPVMKILDAVVRVLPIEIVQLEVLSDADSEMSVTYAEVAVDCTAMPVAVDCTAIPEEVLPTKTAVDVNSGTSIKNHAVPSFAMAQSPPAVPVTGKNRLVALAVLGVLVVYLNVTTFAEPFDHEPVYVQTRNTFAFAAIPCGCSNANGS